MSKDKAMAAARAVFDRAAASMPPDLAADLREIKEMLDPEAVEHWYRERKDDD